MIPFAYFTFHQNRTDVQCQHRWQKVLNPELIKGPWTKEEDQRVISFPFHLINALLANSMCWGTTPGDFGGLDTNMARGRLILSVSVLSICLVLSEFSKKIN